MSNQDDQENTSVNNFLAIDKPNLQTILLAVFYALTAVVCFSLFNWVRWGLTVVGALGLAYGIFVFVQEKKIFDKNNPTATYFNVAVGSIVTSFLTLFGAWLFPEYILMILGIVLFGKGFANVLTAVLYAKSPIYFKNLFNILQGVFSMATGAVLFSTYWLTAFWMYLIAGGTFLAIAAFTMIEGRIRMMFQG